MRRVSRESDTSRNGKADKRGTRDERTNPCTGLNTSSQAVLSTCRHVMNRGTTASTTTATPAPLRCDTDPRTAPHRGTHTLTARHCFHICPPRDRPLRSNSRPSGCPHDEQPPYTTTARLCSACPCTPAARARTRTPATRSILHHAGCRGLPLYGPLRHGGSCLGGIS